MPVPATIQSGVAGATLVALVVALSQPGSPSKAPERAPTEQVKPAPPPSSVAANAPAISWMESSTLEVSQRARGAASDLLLLIRNDDTLPAPVRLHLVAYDSSTGRDGSFDIVPDTATVPALGIHAVRLTVKARPGGHATGTEKGHLVMIAGTGSAKRTLQPRPIRIIPRPEAPAAMTRLLGVGFLLGIIAVLAGKPWRIGERKEALAWSRDSVASNLTLIGSALVTFSGLAAPTATFHYMTRAQYGTVAALLSGIVLLAPAINGFLSAGFPRQGVFLALFATVGAAFSQLATLGMLIREAYEAAILPRAVYAGTEFIVVSAATALGLYTYGLVRGMRAAGGEPTSSAGAQQRTSTAFPPEPTIENTSAAPPDKPPATWHLP